MVLLVAAAGQLLRLLVLPALAGWCCLTARAATPAASSSDCMQLLLCSGIAQCGSARHSCLNTAVCCATMHCTVTAAES